MKKCFNIFEESLNSGEVYVDISGKILTAYERSPYLLNSLFPESHIVRINGFNDKMVSVILNISLEKILKRCKDRQFRLIACDDYIRISEK